MGDNGWVWWLLAALVVLLVIAAVVWIATRRKRSRAKASRLREQASAGSPTIDEHESSAKDLRDGAALARQQADDLRGEADRAERKAQDLETRADQAVLAVRDERDQQTETFQRADEIDPDTKH